NILGIQDLGKSNVPETEDNPIQEGRKPLGKRLFKQLGKFLGKAFGKAYEASNKGKKKDIREKIKIIGGNITKVKKGEFSYDQYVKLCGIFEISEEQFDDYPTVEESNSSEIRHLNLVTKDSANDQWRPAGTQADPSGDLEG